ncbi:MAG: cell division topological specificity factor MinE [bacterium]|nr:cell division topological specificity factor MinE [bacterium]
MVSGLLGWLRRDPVRRQSGRLARERLRLVLVHDRTHTSPGILEMLREDLVDVISSYMDIDRGAMEVSLSRAGDSVMVVASIPVIGVRRQLPGAG